MAQLNPIKTAQLHQTPGNEHLSVFEEIGPNGEIIEEYIATHPRPAVAAGPIGSEPDVPGAPSEEIPVDPIAQLVPPMGGWALHPSDPNWGNPAFMAPEGHSSYISPDTWLSIKRDYDQEQYQIQSEADDELAREAAAPKSSGQPYKPELGFWGNIEAGLGRMVEDAPNVPGKIAESVGEFGRGIAEGIPQGFTSSAAAEAAAADGNGGNGSWDAGGDGSGTRGGQTALGGSGGTTTYRSPEAMAALALARQKDARPEAVTTLERLPGARANARELAAAAEAAAASQEVKDARADREFAASSGWLAEGGLVKRKPDEYAKGGVVKRKGYSSPQPVGMANGGLATRPNLDFNYDIPFGAKPSSIREDANRGRSRGISPPTAAPTSASQVEMGMDNPTSLVQQPEEEVVPPSPNVTNGAYNQNMDDFYMQDGGKVEQTDDTVTLTHDQIKALADKARREFEGRQRDFNKGEKCLRFVDVNGNNIPSPRPMADGGPIRVDEESLVDRKPTDIPMPPGTDEEIGVADDLPRNLSEGEFVIPAHVVKHFGENFFNDLVGSVKPPKALMKKKPV